MADFGQTNEEAIYDEGGTSEGVLEEEEEAAPPEPEPTPEAKAVDDEPKDPPKDPPKEDNPAKSAPEGYVPKQALSEARWQLEEMQKSLEQANQKLGMVDSLKEQLDALRKAGETTDNQDPAPDKEQDPLGYVQWENRQLKRDIETIKQANQERTTTEQASQEQQKQFNDFMTTVSTRVNEFIADQPDYPDAFVFAMNKRMAEYEAMGVTNPNQKAQMFDREVMQVASTALQNRKNPGEAMYNLAKSWGYSVKKSDDPKPDDKNDKSLQDHLDRLEKGQKAGSMSTARGDSPADLSVEDMLGLSDEEFDREWEKRFGGNSIY